MNEVTFKLVVSLLDGRFERFSGTFQAETDLVALSADDPEELEWALEDLQRSLELRWPRWNGRRAQLLLPDTLTVSELCTVVDAGEWPSEWTKPGKTLWF